MNGLFADLRFALRQFGRRPAFYLLVAGILALGIGANVAMFTLTDAALFRPLPIADQDRVVRLFVTNARDNPEFSNGSYPQYEDLAANKPGISDVAAFSDWAPLNVSLGAGEPERVRGGLATGSFFDVLGLRAAAGRLVGRDDDRSFGGHPVAVLSHHYWRMRFEGAPDVVGRTIVVNRTPIQVIGVAPAGFTGLNLDQPVDMWLPMSMAATALPEQGREGMLRDRGFSWLDFVARVAPDRDLASFRAELSAFSERMVAARQADEEKGAGDFYRAIPAREAAVDAYGTEGHKRNAWLLSGVVALLLALAAANVGGLLAARADERVQELAVRLGLGATRGRVARQLMVECALVAALGVAAALWIARVLLVAVAAEAPDGVILPLDPASAVLDTRVLIAALASASFAVFAAGLVPALRSVRVDVAPVLKGSAPSATRGALRHSWRGALVALQISMSVVLLVAAGLLLRAFENTARVAPGFDPSGGLSFTVDLARHGVPEDQQEATLRRIGERVAALPGVRAAAWANSVPIQNGGMRNSIDVDEPGAPKGPASNVDVLVATAGYTEALGLTLQQGRLYRDDEAAPVVMVNRAMAELFWPGKDPLGRRILNLATDKGGAQVVGVVSNNKQRSLREQDRPIIYVPFKEFTVGTMSLLLRTEGDPLALVPAVQRAVRELEPELPLLRVRTLEDRMTASYSQARLFAYLTSAYALLAAVLAGAGLYGVLSSALSSRTREIGLRVALGASRDRVARLVLMDTAIVVVAGLAFGLAGALALSRVLEGLLFGVGARDPLTLALVCAAIGLVGLLASAWPLRRALAIQPMVALRHE